MRRLAEAEDDEYLEEVKRLEERLGSVDYDVWMCRDCSDRLLLRHPRWFSRFGKCAQCGNRTCARIEKTLIIATASSSGIAEVTENCEYCTLPAHVQQDVAAAVVEFLVRLGRVEQQLRRRLVGRRRRQPKLLIWSGIRADEVRESVPATART